MSITILQNTIIIFDLLIQLVDPASDSVRLLGHLELRAIDILDLGVAEQILRLIGGVLAI